MSVRVLFVRAVNVGGVSLPMAQFRALLADLGATDVRTYIASGNAVADVDGDPDAFDRAVEAGLRDRFGVDREVMSRTPGELRAALGAHPFDVDEEKYSYVSFLSAPPTAEAIEAASAVRTGNDLWRVIGRELHVRYANGAGRADLDHERLARALGVAATARNLRTVRAVIDLAEPD